MTATERTPKPVHPARRAARERLASWNDQVAAGFAKIQAAREAEAEAAPKTDA